MRISVATCVVALLTASVASAGPGSGKERNPTCFLDKAQFAVGRPYSKQLAEEARQAAQARVVRKLDPGRSYTMEYLEGRLSLDLDGRGVVRAVRCG